MVGLFCFVSCLGLLVTNYRIPHGIYFLLVVVQLTISYFYMRVDTVECRSKAWAESRSEFGSYFDSQVSSWRLTSCRKCSLDAPRPPPRESQHRHRHTDAPLPLHPTTTMVVYLLDHCHPRCVESVLCADLRCVPIPHLVDWPKMPQQGKGVRAHSAPQHRHTPLHPLLTLLRALTCSRTDEMESATQRQSISTALLMSTRAPLRKPSSQLLVPRPQPHRRAHSPWSSYGPRTPRRPFPQPRSVSIAPAMRATGP